MIDEMRESKEKLEERFDDAQMRAGIRVGWVAGHKHVILSFIHSELSLQRKQWEEAIERMKNSKPKDFVNDAYNLAIDAVLASIRKEEK